MARLLFGRRTCFLSYPEPAMEVAAPCSSIDDGDRSENHCEVATRTRIRHHILFLPRSSIFQVVAAVEPCDPLSLILVTTEDAAMNGGLHSL